MTSVIAIEKETSRVRPVQPQPVKPVREPVTSHAAICPHCGRETRVGLGVAAIVYGGCVHFRSIQQNGSRVSIVFTGEAA